MGPIGPCILDQRLHTKPHHQPILFVDDSLAPHVQLPPKPNSFSPAVGQIPASRDAFSGSHVPPPNGKSDQKMHARASHGSHQMGDPPGKLPSSCDEAESISSSPRATPFRLMQQLMSHGKAFSHATKHQSSEEADSAGTTSADAELLRQASSNSNVSSSSSRLRVAGPSHGSDSRFAAMKSLTRNAISPRHAVSLDSPAKLAATRHWGTIAHKHQPNHPNHDPGTDAKPQAGYHFDLGTSSLSPASSFGGSQKSSFVDDCCSAGLAHLVSAPVVGSRQGSFSSACDAAAAFAELASASDGIASLHAPLLAAAAEDSSTEEESGRGVAFNDALQLATDDIPEMQTFSDKTSDGIAHHDDRSAEHVRSTASGSLGAFAAGQVDSGSVMVHVPAAMCAGVSKQLEQLPLSHDSLDFSLNVDGISDPAESDSQQLLQHTDDASSCSLMEGEQSALQRMGNACSSMPEAKQAMVQTQETHVQVFRDKLQQPLQQADLSSASYKSSQLLDQHGHGSFPVQQDQQLSCAVIPSAGKTGSDHCADDQDQQSHARVRQVPVALVKEEEQPVMPLSDIEPLQAAELMALGSADGRDSPSLPPAIGASDGPSCPILPMATGITDGGRAGGISGERQQVCEPPLPSLHYHLCQCKACSSIDVMLMRLPQSTST